MKIQPLLVSIVTLLAVFTGTPAAKAQDPETSNPRGVTGVTREGPDIRRPPSTPPGQSWRYGYPFPFQIAPRKAAAFVSLRIRNGVLSPVAGDLKIGVDVFLFDKISNLGRPQVIEITRNHEQANPHSTPPGQAAVMVKHIARCGFVPRGAKRPDGSLHPHAGGGFALSQAIAWRPSTTTKPAYGLSPFRGREQYVQLEVHQLAYDGQTFRVVKTERRLPDEMLSGWKISGGGLKNAIPDGDDLLLAMVGSRPGGPRGPGVLRWRRQANAWRPESFVQVVGDGSSEPSLVRDVDGSLLFCARGPRFQTGNDIRVWRSADDGQTWKKVIHVTGGIGDGPITINRAVDGTPFILASLYQVLMHPLALQTPSGQKIKPKTAIVDKQGRVRAGGWLRNALYLWPLDPERTGLEAPLPVRDCHAEFGRAPAGSVWRADHAQGGVVRLADGKWHSVIGYRILEDVEAQDLPVPPQTGGYLEEVLSSGAPRPEWSF